VTLRQILAAVLVAVLLGAAPVRPTIYGAPAGDRPTGAPKVSDPFDAILPNGRIIAPVGISAIVGADAGGVALSPDGKYAVVSNAQSLAVVDAATMRVVSTYTDGDGGFAHGIVAVRDPSDGSKTLVLVAGGSSNALHFLDLGNDGRLLADGDPLPMPASDVSQIALSTDGRTAYVAHRAADTVSSIDIVQRRVMSDTLVGLAPSGLAAVAGHLYVTNEGVAVSGDQDRSSSLDALTTQSDGDIDGDPSSASVLRSDPIPDGTATIGGAHPSALAVSPDANYAYVCMTDIDRIEVVGLTGTLRPIGGISMQLYTGWPYGTQPDAIVGSADGKRIYVALAGVNAVAIVDSSNPLRLRRLGLVPTGWYPSALALSPDGSYLFVANPKGTVQVGGATLQRIDLHHLDPGPVTLAALRYNRVATFGMADAVVPPIRSGRRSSVIKHVVFVLADGTPLDATVAQGAMPNLQALANAFATAGNMTPDAQRPDDVMQFALGGIATAYELETHIHGLESYPRAGYIFNSLAQSAKSYRDYGTLTDDGLNVPALAALADHLDLDYPGSNPRIPNADRAAEFGRDFAVLVGTDTVPEFTSIWLSAGDNGPADAADADRALGRIVDYLTHVPQWSSTAIFILDRGRAIVVSPYARRGYFGRRHLSTVSVLKTEEELLGLPALSLNDLLATDMADFFTPTADSASFVAVPVPAQVGQSGPGSGVEPRTLPTPSFDIDNT
jgi:DNA-binding beta-propeller fold protein YncE